MYWTTAQQDYVDRSTQADALFVFRLLQAARTIDRESRKTAWHLQHCAPVVHIGTCNGDHYNVLLHKATGLGHFG